MKKRPQGGLSPAALSDASLRQGNMLVSKGIMNPYQREEKKKASSIESFVLVLQMRKEYVMCRLSLDHLSLFCDTTGTPGKLPTTISRGTATSGLKVCRSKLKILVFQNLKVKKNINSISGNN